MKKRNIIKLAVKMAFGKNSRSFLLFMGLVLTTALPYIVYTVSDSMYNSVAEKSLSVYGNFTDIYYDESIQTDTELRIQKEVLATEFEGFYFEKAGGLFTIAQWSTKEGKTAVVGHADDIAMELGNIKLIDGHMPQKDNELAITKSMLEQLYVSAKIGDSIELLGEKYTISGIVEEYGRLWPSGEVQEREDVSVINIFVTNARAKELCGEGYKRIILFERLANLSGNYQNQLYFYDNVNSWNNSKNSVFTVPDMFVYLMYICVFLIVLNILYLSRENIKKSIHICYILGMNEVDRRFFLICRYMIVNIVSVIVGWGIGIGISKYVIKALSKNTDMDISYYGIKSMFIVLLVFLITCICIGIFVVNISTCSNEKKTFKIRKIKKTTVFRMSLMEFSVNSGRFGAMVMLLTFLIVLVAFSVIYKNIYINKSEHIELTGKLPSDYDYQVYVTTRSGLPGQGDVALLYTGVEKDMLTLDTINRIADIEGVDRVKAYKTDVNSYLLLDKETKIDAYLDAMDFCDDGLYNNYFSGLNISGYEIFGYTDNLVIPIAIRGYSAEEILGYADCDVEGIINIDKINAGEEIVLIAPPVKLEPYGRGTAMNRVSRTDEEATVNEFFKVGDEIYLSRLVSDDVINGAIDVSVAADVLKRKDIKVKIGAIIYDYVGWSDKELYNFEAYVLMVTNEFFNSHGYDDVYSGVRIYIDNDADYWGIKAELYDILADYPYAMVEDYRLEVSNFKSMNFMVKLFVTIMIILVIVTAFLCIISQMFIQLRFNRKKYMLLRVNGLTRAKLSLVWIIQYAVLTVAGIVLSGPILLLLSNKLLYIPIEGFMNYISVQEIIFAVITTMVIVAISILAMIFKYRKENICEAIRE